MTQSQFDLNRLIDELKDATRNKRAVTVTYRGHARRLCPHVLGRKVGRWRCLFYQSGGTGDPGLGPVGSPGNWRSIPLEDITDLEVVGGRWHTAPEASRPPGCIDQVHAEAPARRPPVAVVHPTGTTE